ncbi:hypothetical protein ACN6IQ_02750 [Fannyhessea vaginae]|uniref:hypothetical protein n=1 Tax=Fannyhessea vaginae TaxID=82135 RepID=UPI003B21841D
MDSLDKKVIDTTTNHASTTPDSRAHGTWFAHITGPLALGAILTGVATVGLAFAAYNGMLSPRNEALTTQQLAQELENEITTPTEFKQKTTTYAADTTTDVLLDAPDVDANDIVKIIKHGDHWHVFTKDGREIITYKDPTLAHTTQDLRDVHSVVSNSELTDMGVQVVRILQHGNHWHVYTSDGREFITYSNPSSYYPNITIGTYTGSHNHESYTHPAFDGGSGQDYSGTPSYDSSSDSSSSSSVPNIPGLVEVHSGLDEIKNKDIVKILKHEDHWHVYDRDGHEYVVHTDPSSLFPHAFVGEYDKNVDNVVVEDGDLFDYNDVASENKVSLSDLDKVFADLKYMKAYDAKTNRFYAWHMAGNPHIHSHALEDIIKSVKADAAYFTSKHISAQDVVATVKWLIDHPESQPQDEINKDYQKEYAGHSAQDWLVDNSVKKPSRIVKDKEYGSVFYWVFYNDGTAAQRVSDISAYEQFHLTVEDYTKIGDLNATLESVEADVCKKLGVTTDDFEKAWLALPVNSSIHAAVFNDDGTVTIYGTTYSFLKDKVDSRKNEAAQAQNSAESNASSAEPANISVESHTSVPDQKEPTSKAPADLGKVSDSSPSVSKPASAETVVSADHDVSASANTNADAPVSQ